MTLLMILAGGTDDLAGGATRGHHHARRDVGRGLYRYFAPRGSFSVLIEMLCRELL